MFSFIDWAQGPLTDLLWSGRSGSGKIYDKFGNFRRQRQFLGEFRPQRDLEQVYATRAGATVSAPELANGRWTQASLRRNQPGETLPVSRLQGPEAFLEVADASVSRRADL